MKHRGCPYRAGERGRLFTSRPGAGGPTTHAHLECRGCGVKGTVNCRADATPRQIDDKFIRLGWKLDPHLCVVCQRPVAKQEKEMTGKPTAAAMAAQVKTIQLLGEHFDPAKGAYAPGWSDARIAKATELSTEAVVGYRKAGFGELKEPPEIASLRNDINAAEALWRETSASYAQAIAELRSRLATLTAKFPA